MTLEIQKVDGRDAVVVPMTADLELSSEDDAEIYKVVFLDGSEIRFLVKEQPDQQEQQTQARQRRALAAINRIKTASN